MTSHGSWDLSFKGRCWGEAEPGGVAGMGSTNEITLQGWREKRRGPECGGPGVSGTEGSREPSTAVEQRGAELIDISEG